MVINRSIMAANGGSASKETTPAGMNSALVGETVETLARFVCSPFLYMHITGMALFVLHYCVAIVNLTRTFKTQCKYIPVKVMVIELAQTK